MLTIERGSRQQPSRWTYAHQCEAFAVATSKQSHALDIFWFSRSLVPNTHDAVEWVFDRLELLALNLNGPILERATLWLRSVDAQRRIYSRLYSGEGFTFEAPDASGVVYMLSVSPPEYCEGTSSENSKASRRKL
ncbi:hypothetical protein [Streptomyces jumonjinensis]|uniref:hypothetical protein n=1 Tax=Streptomyces jumonjinensis TaxID=1945 RepID=UPI0037BC0AA8